MSVEKLTRLRNYLRSREDEGTAIGSYAGLLRAIVEKELNAKKEALK